MTDAVEKARAALAKAEAEALRAKGWRPLKTAPKDGERVHLWMQIYASALSMGMSDEFAVPDCWFDGAKWVHDYRGKPTELNDRYITHWQPAANSLEGIEVWKA